MRITHFEHSEFCSIGLAVGEGLAFRFPATNDTGSIEEWHEKVDGEWQVVTGPPPLYLQTLIALKMRRRTLATRRRIGRRRRLRGPP